MTQNPLHTLMEKYSLTRKDVRDIIRPVTSVQKRTLQRWLADPSLPSYRRCPKNVFFLIDRLLYEKAANNLLIAKLAEYERKKTKIKGWIRDVKEIAPITLRKRVLIPHKNRKIHFNRP